MIHSTAIVSGSAQLGSGVEIGAYSIIGDNVIIGDNSAIESHCSIGVSNSSTSGHELTIGKNSQIRSHSIFYTNSSFGDGLVTGHQVIVREGTLAGDSFQIGSQTEIQGDCHIGTAVRLQSRVFIAKGSQIGNFVWLLPNVTLTNDPHPPSDIQLGVKIGDFAVLAAMSTVLPGVTIGPESLVGAGSVVTRDVPMGRVVYGSPARIINRTTRIHLRNATGTPAYPWRSHFIRGYSEEVIRYWNQISTQSLDMEIPE